MKMSIETLCIIYNKYSLISRTFLEVTVSVTHLNNVNPITFSNVQASLNPLDLF